jgi:hypothetical protein
LNFIKGALPLAGMKSLDTAGSAPMPRATALLGVAKIADVSRAANPRVEKPKIFISISPTGNVFHPSASKALLRRIPNLTIKNRRTKENPWFYLSDCLSFSYGAEGSNGAGEPGIGASMSSLRITRVVVLNEEDSKPWPWVMASVGQASTQ